MNDKKVNIRLIKLFERKHHRTCSITSGAIQHGVPTNVCLTESLERSLPVANQALTPKSEKLTKF